jgi:hypothetical protein
MVAFVESLSEVDDNQTKYRNIKSIQNDVVGMDAADAGNKRWRCGCRSVAGADQSWLSAAVDRRRSLTPASLPEKLHGARSSVEESCFYGKTGCARYR